MITRDLYQHYLRPTMSNREGIVVARSTIVVMVVLGVLIGGSNVLQLIINYSFLAFAFRADSMLIPVVVAAIGPRLRLNTAGAGVGALALGMISNIVWNVFISAGGEAVFIGLIGSAVGMLIGHAISLSLGGKRIAEPGFDKAFESGGSQRVSLEG